MLSYLALKLFRKVKVNLPSLKFFSSLFTLFTTTCNNDMMYYVPSTCVYPCAEPASTSTIICI